MSRQLEVGDELVEIRDSYNNKSVGRRLTIERITKTQAISGKSKFKLNLGEQRTGYPYAVGIGVTRMVYSKYYLYTPTLQKEMDQIKEAFDKASRISELEVKLTRHTLRKLTPEELDIVEAIADKYIE